MALMPPQGRGFDHFLITPGCRNCAFVNDAKAKLLCPKPFKEFGPVPCNKDRAFSFLKRLVLAPFIQERIKDKDGSPLLAGFPGPNLGPGRFARAGFPTDKPMHGLVLLGAENPANFGLQGGYYALIFGLVGEDDADSGPSESAGHDRRHIGPIVVDEKLPRACQGAVIGQFFMVLGQVQRQARTALGSQNAQDHPGGCLTRHATALGSLFLGAVSFGFLGRCDEIAIFARAATPASDGGLIQ